MAIDPAAPGLAHSGDLTALLMRSRSTLTTSARWRPVRSARSRPCISKRYLGAAHLTAAISASQLSMRQQSGRQAPRSFPLRFSTALFSKTSTRVITSVASERMIAQQIGRPAPRSLHLDAADGVRRLAASEEVVCGCGRRHACRCKNIYFRTSNLNTSGCAKKHLSARPS